MTASQSFTQKLYEQAARRRRPARRRRRAGGGAAAGRRRGRRRRDRRRARRVGVSPMPISPTPSVRPTPPAPTRLPVDGRPAAADEPTPSTIVDARADRSVQRRARRVPRRSLQRLQADFENYQKRVAEAASATTSSAPTGALVEKLLPVLDACDGAHRATASTDVEPICVGAARRAARRRASSASTPSASPSTPTQHDAVMHEPRRRRRRARGQRRHAHRLPLEGPGAAAGHGEGARARSAMAPQREWFEKDYYKVLGVLGDGRRQKEITKRLPQAGARAPPRRQPRRRHGRGALQGDLGRLRRASATRRSARSTTRSAGSGPMGGGLRRPGRAAARGLHVQRRRRRRPRRPARRPVRPRRRRRRGGRAAAPARSAAPISRPSCTCRSTTPCRASPPRSTSRATRRARPATARARSRAPRPTICPRCGGRGVLDDNQGLFSFCQPCPQCGGRGHGHRRPVPDVPRHRRRAPAPRGQGAHPGRASTTASASGSRAGAGPAATAGPPGDLYVDRARVEPHPLFGRNGRNLTLDGAGHVRRGRARRRRRGADARRRPGHAQDRRRARRSGSTFRVKGRGVPTSKGAGDLLVTVEVAVPAKLSARASARRSRRWPRRAHESPRAASGGVMAC